MCAMGMKITHTWLFNACATITVKRVILTVRIQLQVFIICDKKTVFSSISSIIISTINNEKHNIKTKQAQTKSASV